MTDRDCEQVQVIALVVLVSTALAVLLSVLGAALVELSRQKNPDPTHTQIA